MKTKINILLIILIVTLLFSCSSDDSDSVDREKPTITINYENGFPKACNTLQRGQTYTFRAQVSDNSELASYSINVHHNFDHHTHDNQAGTCDLEEDKTPVNPLLINENYTIQGYLTSYEIMQEIEIPTTIDTGDYHCQFTVTDQTGWQSITSVDIKIIN